MKLLLGGIDFFFEKTLIEKIESDGDKFYVLTFNEGHDIWSKRTKIGRAKYFSLHSENNILNNSVVKNLCKDCDTLIILERSHPYLPLMVLPFWQDKDIWIQKDNVIFDVKTNITKYEF